MTSKEKTKSLVNKATTDDRNPPSGYLLKELSSRTMSIAECQTIEDLVVKKLSKNKPYIKYKSLRIVKFLCENGSPNWRRAWQRNTNKLRDAQQFRGPPDPIYGDAPYQQVRKAAKDAMQAIFQQPQIDSSHIKNRIKTIDGGSAYTSSSYSGTSTFGSGSKGIYGGSSVYKKDEWDKKPMPEHGNTSYQPTERNTTFEPLKSSGVYGSSSSSYFGASTFNSNPTFAPLHSKRKKGAVGGVWDNDSDDEEDENDYAEKPSDGLFEKRWVENIVKSGGVGIKVMDLPKLVQQFENLSKMHVLEYLDDTLEDGTWQKQGKALTFIEALLKGNSKDDVIDYFCQTPDNIQSLVNHQKSILRKKAKTITEYLNIEDDHNVSSVPTTTRKQTNDDNIFKTRFDALIAQGQYLNAAKLSADTSPQSVLRTAETIQLFEAAPHIGGSAPIDLQYYTFLLQKGALNKAESIGLCKRILQFRPNEGKAKIEKFLKEEKLEKSQELGNLLVLHNAKWGKTVGTKYDLIKPDNNMDDIFTSIAGSDDPFAGLVVGNNDNNNNTLRSNTDAWSKMNLNAQQSLIEDSNLKSESISKELSKYRNCTKEYENKLQEMEKSNRDLELKWNESKQTKENDRKTIFQLTNELNEYRKQHQMQLNKIKSLTIENDKLRAGMKEKDIALNEMKQKIQRMKFKRNDYMEWDCDDVVEWIINIDKSFMKYKHILTTSIKQEHISGANLLDIDKNDLHRFGIQEFSDKTLILKSIQNLVQRNQRNNLYDNVNNNNIIAFQANADAEGLQIVDTMQ